METRASKRLRGNYWVGGSSSNARSSCSLNEDEELIPTMPALVSHIVLTSLRDIALLKSCRLVCKCWNIDATTTLRAHSIVSIKEAYYENTDFDEIIYLLSYRDFGPLKNLPSPFQDFHVKGRKFKEPDFIELVLLPNLKITKLKFDFRENPIPSQLGLILAANRKNITDLTITAGDFYKSYEELITRKDIKLKALKSFTFREDCNSSDLIVFVNTILSKSKLERMNLDVCNEKILISLLEQDKVENLKHLSITSEEVSAVVALNHLHEVRFRELKTLTFKAYNLVNESIYLQQLHTFYKNVSPFLKEFETNSPISNSYDLRFPCLENLKVQNNTVLSALNPDSFPALSKVCLEVKQTLLANMKNAADPHTRVRSLEISVKNQYRMDYFQQDLPTFFTYLSRQFPKVSTLVLDGFEFSSKNLTAICESFNKMKTLDLNGAKYFYEEDLSSASNLEKQRRSKKFPLGKSVIDLIEWESIFFGSSFFVHPDVIIQWLPNLPKLRSICLHWNADLSANLLRQYVGHLEKITICDSSKIPKRDMVEVSKLPNVHFIYPKKAAKFRCHWRNGELLI